MKKKKKIKLKLKLAQVCMLDRTVSQFVDALEEDDPELDDWLDLELLILDALKMEGK